MTNRHDNGFIVRPSHPGHSTNMLFGAIVASLLTVSAILGASLIGLSVAGETPLAGIASTISRNG